MKSIYYVEMPLSDKDISDATDASKNAKYEPAFGKQAIIIGNLAELSVHRYFEGSEIVNDKDYDIKINGITIEVKGTHKKTPINEKDVFLIPVRDRIQNADFFVLCNVHVKEKVVRIMGCLTQQQYRDRLEYIPEGTNVKYWGKTTTGNHKFTYDQLEPLSKIEKVVYQEKQSKKTSWDKYFLNICNAVSENSKCYSRKVGVVIVKDKSIISTGYNGPPRGVPSCNERYNNMLDTNLVKEFIARNIPYRTSKKDCPRRILGFKSGEGLEWCVAGHGERNALINAARVGVSVKDCIMYMNCPVPCSPCLVEIINAGISEIVITSFEHYDIMSKYLIEQSKLKVRTYDL